MLISGSSLLMVAVNRCGEKKLIGLQPTIPEPEGRVLWCYLGCDQLEDG